MLLVDTGVLLAAADRGDPDHDACADLLELTAAALVTTPLVVAEAAYRVKALAAPDYTRIADLVEQSGDLPLGGTDASLVALAERLAAQTAATLDHRHFRVVRPSHVGVLTLVP